MLSTQDSNAADAVVYVVPANSAVKITSASLANITAAAVTCGVGIVPAGAAVGDGTHKVIPDGFSIAPNDTQPLDVLIGAFLGEGDRISLHPSVVGAVDIVLTGLVIS